MDVKNNETATPGRGGRRLMRLIPVVVALVASIACMCFKEGWHIDEIATLGLANGSQNGYITAYDDTVFGRGAFLHDVLLGDSFDDLIQNVRELLTELREKGLTGMNIRGRYLSYLDGATPVWKTGGEYMAFMSAEEGFSLRDVYVNQALDTHPPLYYVLVRAAYALFALFAGPSFSLWPAFILNLCFLAGICLLCLRIGARRFGSAAVGAAAALLYALSAAGLGNGVYMRMYAMLAFFAVWSLDCHLEWLHARMCSRSLFWRMVASTALGFLTHYYFAIYACCLALVCATIWIARRYGRGLWRYIGRMMFAAAITLAVWPVSVAHLLLSNRSSEALSSVNSADAAARLSAGWRIVCGYLCGSGIVPVALLLAAVSLWLFVRFRRRSAAAPGNDSVLPECDVGGAAAAVCGIPAALFVCIVAWIAPYEDLRYYACVLPACALSVALCVRSILHVLPVRRALANALCVAVCICVACASLLAGAPPYLYTGARETKAFVADCEGLPCVYVTSTNAAFYREMPDLARYERTLVVRDDELSVLSRDETLADADEIILYIHDSYSQTDMMRAVLAASPFTEYEVLAASSTALDARAYRLTK